MIICSSSKRNCIYKNQTLLFTKSLLTMSSSPPLLLPFNNNTEEEDIHPSPFQNLKPSILIIILILSITILISISLCLLLRHLNRRCLRHLSPSPHPTITASSSSNRHSGHRVSPENLPFSVVHSLPLFSFGSIKRRSSNSVNAIASGDCAVCLSKFEPEDLLCLLPLCCHAFHTECIDTWLQSNQTCPLCRSPIHASETDLVKALSSTVDGSRSESFRLEIGSISRRQAPADSPAEPPRSSYSVGSFDYIVEEESEITMSHTHRRSISDKENGVPVTQPTQEPDLASEVAAGRSWLKDYVDRLSASLSSRALSFRSSGRFFTGSSRRSEIGSAGDYDMEASRVGEEISELFRWFSGV